MSSELRLLILEDAAEDAEIAAWHLKNAGLACAWRCVETEADFRDSLRKWHPDLILSDFTLPHFDGLSALAAARDEAPDVPFIFLSGTIGEERAIEALKRGAVDYVLKTNLTRLAPAVERALSEADLRRSRQVAEERAARLSRVLQMLSGINSALVRIRDRDELMGEACRLAHGIGGYAFAFVALIDPGTDTARPVAWAGENAQALTDQIFTVADTDYADTSVTGRVLRTGEALVWNGGQRTAAPGYQMLRSVGSHSLACLPLTVDGTPVGAFMFGAAPDLPISEEELPLLKEVAANLSFALQYLEKQDAVRFLSYFDPLTGLAKRALLCERLGRVLARRNEAGHGANALSIPAVTVFDIEHLSVVNDSFGRHLGDVLLQQIADRLKRHSGDTEQLAHLGGGTFAAVLSLTTSVGNSLPGLQAQMTAVFGRPFSIEDHEIPVTVRSGLACYPDNGRNAEALVQNAEAALKEAKNSAEKHLRHRFEMNSALAERHAMEHRLRAALEKNQFALHYQPKLSLPHGRITGVEALLRWYDPERGLIGPGVFLPILESTGLILAVGDWVIAQAAADCLRWSALGFSPMRVAVNVSPLQLRRRDFAPRVLAVASTVATHEGWGLDIEITEGALLDDSSSCVSALRALRAAGLKIAIDDFGTGYSSLSRLSQLPIDTLKIDHFFTSRLPHDPGTCTLVSTIIGLARAFQMTTVAEGVETRAQLEFLAQVGCNESQGYLHSHPVPSSELELLLGAEVGRLADGERMRGESDSAVSYSDDAIDSKASH